jgi:nitronate monooxygenase
MSLMPLLIEGPMAGGHLGFKKQQIDDPKYKLENLVSEVSQELNN